MRPSSWTHLSMALLEGTPDLPPVYSIVVPVYNEAEGLAELYRRVRDTMDGTGCRWELILVNDGSRDPSPARIAALCAGDERVHGISLSRNFGFQVAVSAGVDAACGQAVILMDADLQDPPEVIPDLIEKWHAGYDVVYGVRGERKGETWFKRATAGAFYRLFQAVTRINLPLDTGDFRLMDRRVVDALRQMPEQNRFLRGMVSWVGFKQTGVVYQRQARFAGRTKFTLRKMLRFAVDAITGFSTIPLQLASTLGLGFALLSVLVIAGAVIAQGLGSLGSGATILLAAALVMFVGGVQLLCLGIVGEYLGRIYDEVKGRPLYLVEQRWGFADRKAHDR